MSKPDKEFLNQVDMEDVLMSKPDKELRRLLKEEHHYSEKIPTKKASGGLGIGRWQEGSLQVRSGTKGCCEHKRHMPIPHRPTLPSMRPSTSRE